MKPGLSDRWRRVQLAWRALTRPAEIERELEEEMQNHLSQDPAERGRIEANKEAWREAGDLYGLQTLLRDLHYGARLLRRSPMFTAVAVATLGLGIGLNVALFSVVNAVLLQPLPFFQSQRLVALASTSVSQHGAGRNVGWLTVEDWKAQSHNLSQIATSFGWAPVEAARGGARPQVLAGMHVSANFFPTLGIAMALGRNFTEAEDRPHQNQVVILSDGFWRSQMGRRRDVVGQTLELNRANYQIIGVLPASFDSEFFRAGAQVWTTLGYDASTPDACRNCQHLTAIGRLAPGVTLAQAHGELNAIQARLAAQYPNQLPRDAIVAMAPLRTALVGDLSGLLWILLGATALVLLIACANLANLLLARAAQRQREMAVRAALGAGRMRLVRQLLTEGVLLGLLGGAVGIALAWLAVWVLGGWAAGELPRLQHLSLNGGVLLFALAVSLVAGGLVGVVPALRAAHTQPAEVLTSARGAVASRMGARRPLVVVEVALAVVLAVAVGLVLRSFARVSAVAPGFDPTQVTAADFDLSGPAYSSAAAQNQFTRQVLDRLSATPRIAAAAVVSVLPLDPDSYDTRGYFTQDPSITTEAAVGAANAFYDTYFVSPGYFAAMSIHLQRGRLFNRDDMQHPAAAIIVDQALAAKLWPGRNPIGQAMALAGLPNGTNQQWASVVGVVANVHQYGLDRAATPEVYVPYTLNPGAAATLVVRSTAGVAAVRGAIEQAVWGMDGDVPITNLRRLSELVSGSVAQRRLTLELIGLFGALALGLAALGIYGVVAYTTAQRTSEIGMRMALGASRGEIVGLVIGGGLRPAGLGLVLGALAALAAGKALQQLTFDISPSDPATLGVVLAVLALVAAAACAIPAWRASRLDPSVCLREGS